MVLLVSLVPDLLPDASGMGTWPAILGLMTMHVAVAAITVATFFRLLPLPGTNAWWSAETQWCA